MSKRYGLFSAIIVCMVFIFLLASNQLSNNQQRQVSRGIPLYSQDDFIVRHNSSIEVSIREVVNHQRTVIEQELAGYQFPKGTTLKNYTLAAGGQPIRNIVITTWRSGSTFLGDILNAVPGTFYHYEPLLDFGIVQVRGPPDSELAVQNLKNLLNCDYSDMQNYLNYGKTHVYLFTHNVRLWNQCELFPNYCWNATFLSEFCRVFPFQSMKLVRLRLKLAEELLNDPKLNVRVLLLIRDPRGTLQSRKHRDWCPGEPDCEQPKLLCDDMVSDYLAALELKDKYPDRFRAVRYEDLSMNPYKGAQELLKFFNLYFHPNVVSFLDSHTKVNVGGASSTFRNSKSAPFHWRQDLNFSEVQTIEENCDQAMDLWGYVKAKNETHLREFDPLTNFIFT